MRLSVLLFTLTATLFSQRDAPRFEVLVLGTLHAPWQFRDPSYTPAHVRAVLEAARPDVVGVESNPEWFGAGRFHDVTWEAQGIAVPWATARSLPAYGVDWMDIPRFQAANERRKVERYETLTSSRTNDGPLSMYRYGKVHRGGLARLLEWWNAGDRGFRYMNGVDDASFAEKSFRGVDLKHADLGGKRNQEIARRCAEVMKGHAGKRLVVVIGAGHKPVLDVLFARMENVRVLKLGKDIPAPDAAALDAAWTARDVQCLLGHNLDGERSYLSDELVDLDRMDGMIDRLAALRGAASIVDYFRARLLQRRGQHAPALALYDGLAGANEAPELYPYPLGHWRMQYAFEAAVALERARALRALGQKDASSALLETLASGLPAIPPVRRTSGGLKPLAPAINDRFDQPLDRSAWTVNAPAFIDAGRDENRPLEGTGSLRITLKKQRANGLTGVSRELVFTDPSSAARTVTWTVALRGSRVHGVVLEAYIPRDHGRLLVPLGTARINSVNVWRRHHLTFEVPADTPAIRIFTYIRGMDGARLWLDDGQLQHGTPPTVDVPDDWEAKWLAHEFVATLLGS